MNLKLKVSSSNLYNLSKLNKLLKSFASNFNIILLPKKTKKLVVIRSPHVHSKSKEHFKSFKYTRLYYVSFPSLTNLKIFLLKIPTNLTINLKTN